MPPERLLTMTNGTDEIQFYWSGEGDPSPEALKVIAAESQANQLSAPSQAPEISRHEPSPSTMDKVVSGVGTAAINLPGSLGRAAWGMAEGTGKLVAGGAQLTGVALANATGMAPKGEPNPEYDYRNYVKNFGKTAVGLSQVLGEKVFRSPSSKAGTDEDYRQFGEALIAHYRQRYGEDFWKTMQEDPGGVALDLATVFTGGGAGLKVAGTTAKVDALLRAGEVVQKLGTLADPINLIAKGSQVVRAPAAAIATKWGGLMTGIGAPPLKNALKGGKEFDIGAATMNSELIRSQLTDGLKAQQAAKSVDWQTRMAALDKEVEKIQGIDYQPIIDAAVDLEKQYLTGEVPRSTFYRGGGEGEIVRGKTAKDIIKYETDELGNAIHIEKGIDLSNIPSERVKWLTTTKKGAAEYGKVATEVGDYKVIARDNYGGVLVDIKPKVGGRPKIIDPDAAKKAQVAIDLAKSLGTHNADITVSGLDSVRQSLSRYYPDAGAGQIVVSKLEDAVRDTIEVGLAGTGVSYKEMLAHNNYQRTWINEAIKDLGTKATLASGERKLRTVAKEELSAYEELMKKMEGVQPGFGERYAGYATRPALPQGTFGRIAGIGGVATVPGAVTGVAGIGSGLRTLAAGGLTLGTSSPRLMGGALHGYGKYIRNPIKGAAGAVPTSARLGLMQSNQLGAQMINIPGQAPYPEQTNTEEMMLQRLQGGR